MVSEESSQENEKGSHNLTGPLGLQALPLAVLPSSPNCLPFWSKEKIYSHLSSLLLSKFFSCTPTPGPERIKPDNTNELLEDTWPLGSLTASGKKCCEGCVF